MTQSEKEFMDAIIQLAKTLGWKVMHIRDSRRQVKPGVWVGDADSAGWPDLFCVHSKKGLAIALEAKVEKGRTNPKQEEWLDALDNAGIPSYVVRPNDWKLIMRLLGAA